MALKFLNKKGWHTGSLRNIETVWKAEQKHEAEQRKLEELRKQIHEEREKHEFRLLQEQAGLQPRQERLDFLYESGLAVGKGSSEGFQALQQAAPGASSSGQANASSSKSATPGALFEDKPQSANDTWRKLHSDPLLLIRQREQDAIARIKNNPIKMAEIKKSVEAEKKQKEDKKEKHEKRRHKKHHHSESKSKKRRSNGTSDSEEMSDREDDRRKGRHYSPERSRQEKRSRHEKHRRRDSEDGKPRRKRQHEASKHDERSHRDRPEMRSTVTDAEDRKRRQYSPSERRHSYSKYDKSSEVNSDSRHGRSEDGRRSDEGRQESQQGRNNGAGVNRRRGVQHMTEEEREARLRQMQVDAELHEEQRWKRLKKAADEDAKEAASASAGAFRGKSFLDDAQKSISSTIEESVRRRAYYSQGGSDSHERNAFRR